MMKEEDKNKGGRPPYEPSDKDRDLVNSMSEVGITQDQISKVLNIDPKTLRLYYREELDTASIKANMTIGQTLFEKAKSGDTTAMIWWTKARSGWTGDSKLTIDVVKPTVIKDDILSKLDNNDGKS